MRVDLSEANGVTTLVFRQAVDIDEDIASYGAGWEYYLDRLVAIREGTPFADWDDYYPAQLDHWNEQRRQAVAST